MSDKLLRLKNIITRHRSAVVAYSGGLDSTFLLKVCRDVLGKDNVLAVTASSSTYPKSEFKEAKRITQIIDSKWMSIRSEEIDIPGFSDNPPDRCYYCKKELFGLLNDIAKKNGYKAVFDGTNKDDLSDHRPGRKAAKELDVKSPLSIAGFTKQDIRRYSKKLNLPTAEKASFACLASRFPYGISITEERLKIVDRAENILRKMGIKQFRVRFHNEIARLEVLPEDFQLIIETRKKIISAMRKIGFTYVTLDLEGYRTGSMNINLK